MPLFRSRLPLVTIEPCLPGYSKAPPAGPAWVHEIKHDGFRVVARRDGKKVRLNSRNGKDLTYRFPLVVQAIAELPVNSCIIDGEAIVSDATGLAVLVYSVAIATVHARRYVRSISWKSMVTTYGGERSRIARICSRV
jgi:ATP-dependent DNA ligase